MSEFKPKQEDPINIAENLGKEIEAALEREQAMFELCQDTAIAAAQLINSPKTFAKVSAVLDAKYGKIFKDLKEKELRLMLQRMTPEELDAYKKAKAATKTYVVTENDLATPQDLENMGVEVLKNF